MCFTVVAKTKHLPEEWATMRNFFSMNKHDITTRADVELLVNSFYAKVEQSALLGYIFNDIAQVNWEHHLPKMYSFWAGVLLGERTFYGNPMHTHIALSKMAPLTEKEFNEWLQLFTETVDELFEGTKAEEAKERARNVAKMMLYKIQAAL